MSDQFKWDSGKSDGITDHGDLSGLNDDDHPQYLNENRHDLAERHPIGDVVPHDPQKADDAGVVHKTGNETVSGTKTFGSIPILPASNPTAANQAVRKAYLDSALFVPRARVGRTSDLTGLPGMSWIWVAWQTASWDNNNIWNGSTRLVAKTSGWYYFWGAGRVNTGAGVYTAVRKNGSDFKKVLQWPALSASSSDFGIFGSVYLDINQYIELGVNIRESGTFTLYGLQDNEAEFGMELKA